MCISYITWPTIFLGQFVWNYSSFRKIQCCFASIHWTFFVGLWIFCCSIFALSAQLRKKSAWVPKEVARILNQRCQSLMENSSSPLSDRRSCSSTTSGRPDYCLQGIQGPFGYWFDLVFPSSRSTRHKRAPLQGTPMCEPPPKERICIFGGDCEILE